MSNGRIFAIAWAATYIVVAIAVGSTISASGSLRPAIVASACATLVGCLAVALFGK